MFNDPHNYYYTPSGIYTSSVFTILLNHEVARSKRYPSPLSILLFSVCKPAPLAMEIRESVELSVTQVLKTKLRQTDISSQYGEDFLVLLTNTDISGAKIAAARLLTSLNTMIFPQENQPVEIGVCLGLASHPGGASISSDFLLKQVTQANREARSKGPGTLIVA